MFSEKIDLDLKQLQTVKKPFAKDKILELWELTYGYRCNSGIISKGLDWITEYEVLRIKELSSACVSEKSFSKLEIN